MKLSFLSLALVAVGISLLSSSCLPLAAGAAVGYIAADEGYRVQSPIKKTQ